MQARKVGIVGTRITSLHGNPQETLLGNPARSWALFRGLPRYGFTTELFVDSGAPIDAAIQKEFGDRFVRNSKEFLRNVREGNYAAVIVCGTRVQVSIEQHSWITGLTGVPMFLCQCYHNIDDPLPKPFLTSIVGATFVTPRYCARWAQQHQSTRSGLMTTGQVVRVPNAIAANGDAVFVGHIHSYPIVRKITRVAAMDSKRTYHIISSRMREPGGASGDYVAFGTMTDEAERQSRFSEILTKAGIDRPDNFQFHYLLPGEESSLLDVVSVGLDFSWNENWLIDNSKVPYYLCFGLNVVSQLPAPSYRFVQRFNAGSVLPFTADEYAWLDAIQRAAVMTVEHKNQLRQEAGAFFSWDNAVFDLASMMLDYFDHGGIGD